MKTERRGYSLIECLAIIASLSVLMVVCAGLLHTLFRLDRTERNELAEAGMLGRLARQFREDAHASRRVERQTGPREGESLEFLLPSGQRIRYGPAKGWLVRTRTKGDEVLGREEFRLPRRGLPRMEIHSEESTTFAILRFPGALGDARRPTRRELRYVASVGKDLRLTGRDREEATP